MSLRPVSVSLLAMALLASVGFSASSAQAHAHLKSQYPAARASMTAAPQALTLSFSEHIEPAFSVVTLTAADKSVIKTGEIKTDPANPSQIIVPISQPLTAGNYQVNWQVVSVDGHKTHGEYAFSVK